jgi:cysteine desulfurase
MTDPTYLDYNATTPMDPRVLAAMLPWFMTPSNAGSRTHVFGQRAKEAVENARQEVSNVLAVKPEEVFFTSGATESNNIAILGLQAYSERTGRKHIISTTIEHKAVLEPLERMRRLGFDVDLAPVTRGGYVEPEEIRRLLRPDTLLVSVMHANNETGVLQPIHEISETVSAATKRISKTCDGPPLFHVDAAQTFGKEVESLQSLRCDMMSISGHKIYGPPGIGAIYVRRHGPAKRLVEAISFGGGQERGLRPGTVPVALAVGLGEAAHIAKLEWKSRKIAADEFKACLLNQLSHLSLEVNGDATRTQSHVVSLRIPGVESEALMMLGSGSIAISNGSACTASAYKSSHVLTAMGLSENEIDSSVRISWGPGISVSQSNELPILIETLRACSNASTELRPG